MKVIYFLRVGASQAEHTIGFRAVRQIRLISAIKQISALATLHKTDTWEKTSRLSYLDLGATIRIERQDLERVYGESS
jgi:hypothetical protein